MIRVKKQVRPGPCLPGAPPPRPRGRSGKDWIWGRTGVSSPRPGGVWLTPPSVSPWQIWVGGTGRSQGKYKGKIYVIDAQRKTVEKELVAHTDAVKTLCSAEDRYVLSGSGSGEGKIAIWKVE